MSIQNHKLLFSLFRWFVYVCFFCYLLNYKYNFVFVSGTSMEDTYVDNDWSIVSYDYYKKSPPKVGDVICAEVFEETQKEIRAITVIKRILAEEGDWVEIKDGQIIINQKTNTDFSSDKYPLSLSKTKLGASQYFIIGDNRDESMYYIISKEQILGKVLL